jgi:two-component system, NtrC family, response regulator GlrR
MNQSSEVIQPKQLIGESVAFLQEIRKIPIISKYNSSVLVWGETGTGKEICAQMIHCLSPRAANAFIPVNCGAVPVELAENELFGHMRGAFTGAVPSKAGLIREAEGGTLFLDEIDSLPQLAQVKLLRFLQEKTYRPLGSSRELPADVRIIAATNVDPEQAMRSGQLRQDLFYRLNVLSLRLPPLRERKEDIPLLARHFIKKYASEMSKKINGIAPLAMQKLLLYEWPGNVRELEHVLERAIVLCSDTIKDTDVSLPQAETIEFGVSFKEAKERHIEQFEKTYIEGLLLTHRGNISRAAQAAGKHRRAFWELIRKHGIEVQRFKTEGSGPDDDLQSPTLDFG